MNRNKNIFKAIAAIVIVVVLAAAFFLGGDSPVKNDAAPERTSEIPAQTTAAPDESVNEAPEQESGEDEEKTQPEPVEPQNSEKGEGTYSCTISISCTELLPKIDSCAPEVAAIVPENGWILSPVTVTFTEGESVLDVLRRVCMENGIHMEFSSTAGYSSAYIEGIGNLYEFDAGELSGWLYSVNGWFPNYGCSRYKLSDGDEICWVYSPDKSSYGGA